MSNNFHDLLEKARANELSELGDLLDSSGTSLSLLNWIELIKQAADCKESIQEKIIEAAGNSEEKDLLVYIIPFLNSNSPLVAGEAIHAVSQLSDSPQILMKFLRNQKNEELVEDTLIALGKPKFAAISTEFYPYLVSTKESVRRIASVSLGELKNQTSVPFLKEQLAKESSSLVRISILISLVMLGEEDYLKILVKELRDENEDIIVLVAETLKLIFKRLSNHQTLEIREIIQKKKQLSSSPLFHNSMTSLMAVGEQ